MSVDSAQEVRNGFVGLAISDKASIPAVNSILSQYGSIIQGRMGVPDQLDGTAVIVLLLRGTSDQVGAMTGKLGNLPGIQVKSAMLPAKKG